MNYLERHLSVKENPQEQFPGVKSAVVFLKKYEPHPYPPATIFEPMNVARYARGEDYHLHFKNELEDLVRKLKEIFAQDHFWVATDSSPVLERDLAQRAGLGWIGKNTCLINKDIGSYFFIGEILTTLDIEPSEEFKANHCGTCRRCIDACPTKALINPNELDASRCISYLTIESREIPDENLRDLLGDWFFGCDICQAVCPWNEKNQRKNPTPHTPRDRQRVVTALEYLLTNSNKFIDKQIARSPLSRAGAWGLKRNALVVIGNLKLFELKSHVQQLTDHVDFSDLAKWTLSKLES